MANKTAEARSSVDLIALLNIDHDGVKYSPGETLTATRQQADALIAAGAAKEK